MKLATVAVQVALVAAGILVYDQLRSTDPVELAPEPTVVRVETPAPAPAPQPVVLEGRGVDVLVERQGDLDRRVAQLEKRIGERVTVVADSGERPTPSSPDGSDGTEPGETFVDEQGNTRRFSDKDVDWFRALKDEVDAIERRERYVQMFDRQLDRLGISLTDDQQRRVIDETIAFRTRIRDAGRQAADQSPEERRAAMDQLRESYKQTVYSLVPVADADKIVESMGRYPGYGFRSRDAGRVDGGRRR